jgi:hypothetical protein
MNSFMTSDVHVTTAEGNLLNVVNLQNGGVKMIQLPDRIVSCHYTKLGLVVLTSSKLYTVDVHGELVKPVEGFESEDGIGVTGNIEKGMIGVWSSRSVDLYDLVESDQDDEMEE